MKTVLFLVASAITALQSAPVRGTSYDGLDAASGADVLVRWSSSRVDRSVDAGKTWQRAFDRRRGRVRFADVTVDRDGTIYARTSRQRFAVLRPTRKTARWLPGPFGSESGSLQLWVAEGGVLAWFHESEQLVAVTSDRGRTWR